MGKKRNQPEVLSPDLPDTSKSEKEKKQPSEFSVFCRKTSDKSGNYTFPATTERKSAIPRRITAQIPAGSLLRTPPRSSAC